MTIELNLRVLGLPWASFTGPEALAEYRPDIERYERAVIDYEANLMDGSTLERMREEYGDNIEDGSAIDLWEELQALGFDNSEIQWHLANSGKRMPQGFA